MTRETDSDHSSLTRSGPATWVRYTGPGGATGVAVSDADGNIIAGLHKRAASEGTRPGRQTASGGKRPRRGGASNMGVPASEGLRMYPFGRPSSLAWNAQPMPMSPAERTAVAALIIKAAKIMEDLPEGTIDLGHMTADETADVFRALSVCTVLVCYVTQAELRRRGLM